MRIDLRRAGLIGAACAMITLWTACASAPEAPSPTPSLPASTATAAPTLTVTPAPTLTPTPDGSQLQPLLTSDSILVPLGWSPDGAWLAYSQFKPQPSDGATDILLNPSSGVTCPLADQLGTGMQTHTHTSWEWQAGGKLLVIENGAAEIREPCQPSGQDITARFPDAPLEITAASADHRMFLIQVGSGDASDPHPSGDAIYDSQTGEVRAVQPDAAGVEARGISWAPDDRHYAVLGYPDGVHTNAGIVRIVDAETGRLVAHRNMQLWGIDGSFPPPHWVTDDQLLVERTLDLGPFLISTGGSVTRVIPDLVDVQVDNSGTCAPLCLGILTNAGGPAGGRHIMLSAAQPDGMPILYHMETGRYEKLPPAGYRFSPDGKWLWGLQQFAGPPTGFWMRPVDPLGSDVQPIDIPWPSRPEDQIAGYDWSSDSRVMAVGIPTPPHDLILFGTDGREIARWSLGSYWAANSWSLDWAWMGDGVWSPDGKSLLLRGQITQEGGSALFLIRVP